MENCMQILHFLIEKPVLFSWKKENTFWYSDIYSRFWSTFIRPFNQLFLVVHRLNDYDYFLDNFKLKFLTGNFNHEKKNCALALIVTRTP